MVYNKDWEWVEYALLDHITKDLSNKLAHQQIIKNIHNLAKYHAIAAPRTSS